MSNIIRPEFGRRSGDDGPSSKSLILSTPQVLGERAGYRVCLHREAVTGGDVFKVVVAELSSREVENVAVLAALPDGEAEAIRTGMAILRTLEMIEGKPDAPLA
jgi:hypothetical protein